MTRGDHLVSTRQARRVQRSRISRLRREGRGSEPGDRGCQSCFVVAGIAQPVPGRVAGGEEGKVVDQVDTPFGIRSLAWSAEKGLLLNGKSIKLTGGSVHHDNGPLGARRSTAPRSAKWSC